MTLMLAPISFDDEDTQSFDTVVVDLPQPREQWVSNKTGAVITVQYIVGDTVRYRYPGEKLPWDTELDHFLRLYRRAS